MSLRVPKRATVEDKGTKPPVVSEGDLSPEVIKEFEHACLDFFDNKDIKSEDQVKRVLVSFKDHRLRDWIPANREQLHKLSFSEFLSELKSKYLPHDWESKLRIRVLSASFDPVKQMWWDFASYIQKVNSLLFGTDSYYKPEDLRRHLEAKLDPLDRIRVQDETRRHAEKRQREIADEVVRLSKKPLLSSNKVNTNTPGQSKSTTRPRLPALTDEEKGLLRENSGCFKCRRLFVNCRTDNCPNGFPDPVGYQKITQATVEAAKTAGAESSKSQGRTSKSTRTVVVPVVAPMAPTATVAAVLPLESSEEDTGSELSAETDDDSSEVSAVPLSVPHFVWKASVVGPSAS
ncbi:hypothetical protein C0992_001883 [Termitomyces sp. T32_za158]|nr:hypothetical protein C0992_001883 [Termitomyces sp. T32_za158]